MAATSLWTAGRRFHLLWEGFLACFSRVKIRRKERTLRLEETLALGDRRMLAIVEWKGQRLLIGVTPQQITLLEPRRPREMREPEDAGVWNQ